MDFTSSSPPGLWPGLQRERRAVLVVDVVESVRLMLADEPGQIERWRRFVDEVLREVLPAGGGRLVKSLGDGMLLEFGSVRHAILAALEMQRRVQAYQPPGRTQPAMCLRIGGHVDDVVVDALDIFGTGVNLAARVAALAGPGEIVVTAEVRDQVWSGLDAEIEDLGDCYLKHFDQPVRAYRVGPVGEQPVMAPAVEPLGLQPSVAVIPFDAGDTAGPQRVVGELLADGVIAQLSLTADLRVVSRLSCSAFAGRTVSAQTVGSSLQAAYVVSGAVLMLGERLVASVELCDARSGAVVWADRLPGTTAELLLPGSELIDRIAGHVHEGILSREVERARNQPLPALDSCSMLFGAVHLMHRQSRGDFDRARSLLEHLGERHARSATPKAWLAKWYALAAAQGWTSDARADALSARQQVDRALSAEPAHALAWAIKGLLHGYVDADFEAAGAAFARSIENNPNESLAWLFLSTLHGWRGEALQASEAAERALRLSPLDPMKYYFDSLAGASMLGAHRYDRAVELSQRSIRSNRAHLSSFRVLAMAQMLAGDGEAARRTVRELLERDRGFTVANFLRLSPWRFSPDAAQLAAALREAGVPEG